ncbi:MAG: hypothetical protein RL339_1704 [Pseudomonadota bacterium]
MEQQPAPAKAPRYRAFISYSHADTRFANWLHRRIERFAQPDSRDNRPERLAPVFIDRAELAAAPDLSDQVREALAQSAALIVVASPRAQVSRWVDQEIALFRTIHPDRPVLAALIEGEPAIAFPPALIAHQGRAVEPLAADFRKGADGKRLGLLKIVAGLTGHPLDRLVQREAQSRQRRVMAVTAAALLLSLVLSALLVLAIRARAEAERQRASAEGMVEFMLTDLRSDLKGAAGLKVMDAVNARAMAHYSQQDLAALPADSLTRRARLLQAMGEDEAQRGRFAEAERKFQEATRTTAAVLVQRPDAADAIFAHAQSEFWTGFAAWQQGNLESTGRHWRAYLAQAEALARREPGSLRTLMELGYANGNLCELTMRQSKDARQALPWCEKATGLMQQAVRLPAATRQTRLDLANRIGWQADVVGKDRQFDRALSLRREEAAILDALLKAEPDNRQLRERRLWPEIGATELEVKAGRLDSGFARARKTLTAYAVLAAERPDDRSLNGQQLRLAWIAAKAGQAANRPEADAFVREARRHYEVLRRAFPPEELARYSRMIAQLEQGDRP